MNDTHPLIEKKMQELIIKKSEEERLSMAFSMFDFAREIVFSTIKNKKKWRKEMFLRFYGDDFDEITKVKILKKFEEYENRNGLRR